HRDAVIVDDVGLSLVRTHGHLCRRAAEFDGVGDPVCGEVDDADNTAADAVRCKDVHRSVGEGQIADRRPDPHCAVHRSRFGVDDDEAAAAVVGGRDVETLTVGVGHHGVDTDSRAGGDVDGSDALGGGVDDGNVDLVVAGPAGVDTL